MKKLSLFTLLLALWCSMLQAQSYTLTVSGQVTDLNGGAPIPNYPVDVFLDSTNFLGFSYFSTVTTDVNGNYTDVITVPGGVAQGTGFTGLRDCTPAGYPMNTFTYSTNASTISNLDFAICTTPVGGCQADFSFTWVLGSTTVNFADMSTANTGNVNSWTWSFGDGSSSTLQNPNHVYNSMGTYLVCLTIGTSTGCTSTFCDSVSLGNVGPNCQATLTHSLNPNGSVTFTATGTGTGAPISYFFDFDDGNTSSGGSSTATHTYSASGNYSPCVVIAFSDSCTATSCDTVSIGGGGNPLCRAGFYWYPDTSGQFSIIVVDTSTGTGLSYLWSWGDGSSSTLAAPSHQYNGPGTYVVCVTVTSQNPACTSTFCDSITVINKVNAPFTINVVSSQANAVQPQVDASLDVSIAPNPAHDYFQVQMGLTKATNVSLTLMDISGKVVAVQNAGTMATGTQHLRMDTQDLPAGLYLARLQVGDSFSTHKVMIAR